MAYWNRTSELTIPAGTRVLAIECKDVGGPEGILASTKDGLVTNSGWQCSHQLVDGWTLPGFLPPPDTFSSPNMLGSNGVAPWGVRFVSSISLLIYEFVLQPISISGPESWKTLSGSGHKELPHGQPAGSNCSNKEASHNNRKSTDFDCSTTDNISSLILREGIT